jgi:hypothetical protein
MVQQYLNIPSLAMPSSSLVLATAYSFPAPLAVLGPEAWPRLKLLYNKLVSLGDVDVKRTLACSLHEIARLLGPQQAWTELETTIQVCYSVCS